MIPPVRWIVSQLGAREHYAVGRALARRGELATLYTDIWCRFGRRLLRKGPRPVRAFGERWHDDLAEAHVVSFAPRMTAATIAVALANQDSLRDAESRLYRGYAEAVKHHLRRIPLDAARHAFFGYYNSSLEVLRMLRDRGVFCVVDQADPGEAEERQMDEERKRWPGWEVERPTVPTSVWARQREEWDCADRIVVNSEWSRASLVHQGAAAAKVVVIPLAYEPAGDCHPRLRKEGPLTVLWLGSVILRKGIPYLLEAARTVASTGIRFVIVGEICISSSAVGAAPANVTFLGPAARGRAAEFYRAADVFVLPTLSDGFAITQLEAMAHGLPVIATPNCGDVVQHGKNGLLVPAGDSRSLADALLQVNDDRRLLEAMSASALRRSRDFSLGHLGESLSALAADTPR